MKINETTDGRYVQIATDEWWDTSGVEIVPGSVVDQHIEANPAVGIVVLKETAKIEEGPKMQVKYVSDGEHPAVLGLDDLVANFNESGGWHYRANEEDMRHELASRGWYDGLHQQGHYLVLNLEKLGLRPDECQATALRPVAWRFDCPDAIFVGWTDDTRWNGFLNVAVRPLTRDDVVLRLLEGATCDEDRQSASDIAALPVEDGKVWLRDGWSISEVA